MTSPATCMVHTLLSHRLFQIKRKAEKKHTCLLLPQSSQGTNPDTQISFRQSCPSVGVRKKQGGASGFGSLCLSRACSHRQTSGNQFPLHGSGLLSQQFTAPSQGVSREMAQFSGLNRAICVRRIPWVRSPAPTQSHHVGIT